MWLLLLTKTAMCRLPGAPPVAPPVARACNNPQTACKQPDFLLSGIEMLVLVTRVIITRSKSKSSPCPTGFSELPGPTSVSTGQKTRPDWRPGFAVHHLHEAYLTMKSEWASCMMSFSERMCSCCLVSTICRFFRIFMAKVLFSSLLS